MTTASTSQPEPARANAIATLFPGYFALVMATGIIAIASKQQKIDWLADLLYLVAAIAYAVLAVLVVIRLVVFPRRLIADLTSHAKGFAFLTIVAGTNVLAGASAIIRGWWTLAQVLWWCSLPLYVVLTTALSGVVTDTTRPNASNACVLKTAVWLCHGRNGSEFLNARPSASYWVCVAI